jgi:hypothetical protein
MDWLGRAQRPKTTVEQGREASKLEELTMHTHYKSSHAVAVIGIDIGKNTCHLIDLDNAAPSSCASKYRATSWRGGLPICRAALSAWRPALARITSLARFRQG